MFNILSQLIFSLNLLTTKALIIVTVHPFNHSLQNPLLITLSEYQRLDYQIVRAQLLSIALTYDLFTESFFIASGIVRSHRILTLEYHSTHLVSEPQELHPSCAYSKSYSTSVLTSISHELLSKAIIVLCTAGMSHLCAHCIISFL